MNFLIPTCILLFCSSSAVSAQSYKAGVALYKIITPANTGTTPPDQIKVNVDQYQKLMESVKDEVDILVFPEYGLTTLEIIAQQERYLQVYSITVPKVGTQICDPDSKNTLSRLACAAQANNLYAVVNLLEKVEKDKENNNYYVTSVGLDRNGTVCVRCRKHRLFKGVHFSIPPAEEKSCVFNANFKAVNVTFAVMFDTDMLYQIPKEMENEIKNVIMTSSITNGLPLEFGLSLEAGFAVGNDVNLLVSSLWDAPRGFGGSGIYHRNGTSVVAMTAEDVPDALNGSKIIIRDVQLKSPNNKKVDFVAELTGKIPHFNVTYKKFNASAVLADTKKVTEKCFEKLCCNFSADLDPETISPYSWVAIYNNMTILDQTVEVFICALVKPSAEAVPIKFKKVLISSNLTRSQVDQTLPLSLKKDYVPASFGFEEGKVGTLITLNEEAELLTFGILQVLPQKGDGGKAQAELEARKAKEAKAAKEAKGPKEAREAKEAKESKEAKEAKEAKKETKEVKGAKETKDAQEAKEAEEAETELDEEAKTEAEPNIDALGKVEAGSGGNSSNMALVIVFVCYRVLF